MITPEGIVRKTRHSFNDIGHAHELTFSCYQRLPLLAKDRTRLWFLEALAAARTHHHLQLWAFVIMPEHAHLLFFPERDDYQIAGIVKTIKQPVARRAIGFLRKHAPDFLERLKIVWPNGRTEYRFWQPGGGYDRNIRRAQVAWASVDYIHNNPVRRGLVASALDWPWSSARWYAGQADSLLPMDCMPPVPPLR